MITTEFWEALVGTLGEGHRAFLVVVVDSTSGSPGTPGAAMLVRADGTQVGTIGGGIMEYNLLARAGKAIAGGSFPTGIEVLWHRRDAPGTPSGMICSGSQTNLYHLCDPAKDLDVFRQAVAAVRTGGPEVLIFNADGVAVGTGSSDPGAPPIEVDEAAWGVRLRVAGQPRIAIIGGGHCGRALSHTMRRLNYIVSVFDTRADATLFIDNPDAHQCVVVEDYQQAGGKVDCPEATAVVVMTTDYPSDVRAATGILPLPFPFIGIMGSLAKLNHICADLRRAGFSDEDLARLRTPVGLPIGSHTPEEIAISIAAQLIQEAPGRSP